MAANTATDQAQRNTEIVLTAMRELFAEKDITALDRYWAEPYVQAQSNSQDLWIMNS